MSKISLSPDASGTGIFTIASPNSNTNRTLTLPDDTGTIVTNSGNQAGSFTTLNTSGAVVFNDAGADVDFRVEGDTNANLLFVDASADNVGVATSTPSTRLEVIASSGSSTAITRLKGGTTSGTRGFEFATDANGNVVMQGIRSSDNATNYQISINPSGGNVGIGTTSPGSKLQVAGTIGTTAAGGNTGIDGAFLRYSSGAIIASGKQSNVAGTYNPIIFTQDNQVGTAERMRIDASGNLLVGKTATTFSTAGLRFSGAGIAEFVASGSAPIAVNRLASDGNLVEFYQAGTLEGTISVSGNTVSYNPFLGSHSGALADWSRPDIKIGTVMDTINELLEYKAVVIDVQEDVPAKDAVLDEEGNEVEPAQEATTQTVQKRISYNGNGAVGSTATVEYEGQEYTGTIQHEREEPLSFNKHLKVKINDTAASKTVFGVFVGWNNDPNNDGGVYNDMLVGAVGNYVIRMAAGQTPEAGDLVEADGNGCAVVQDDDIIRTKTIAKVTSTIPQVTYDDGSFLVTCVLYCG